MVSAPVRTKAIALALVASTSAAILAAQASRGAPSAELQGHIVFARSVGDNVDLYSVLADGTGLRRLTSAAEADFEPTVSPDGSEIAFVSYRDFKTADADLWLMNANGGNQRRLTDDVTSESTPAWSPDGTRIAFVSDRNRGRRDLYVMNLRSG